MENGITEEQKRQASLLVAKAVKSGELIRPERCSNCSTPGAVEAHHYDYTKPLVVAWLCDKCHALIHNVIRGCNGNRKKGHKLAVKTKLTKREVEILKLVCIGMKNKEIAAKLEVGKRTVETHRERINRFAGVRNGAQMIAWGLAKGHIQQAELTELIST